MLHSISMPIFPYLLASPMVVSLFLAAALPQPLTYHCLTHAPANHIWLNARSVCQSIFSSSKLHNHLSNSFKNTFHVNIPFNFEIYVYINLWCYRTLPANGNTKIKKSPSMMLYHCQQTAKSKPWGCMEQQWKFTPSTAPKPTHMKHY